MISEICGIKIILYTKQMKKMLLYIGIGVFALLLIVFIIGLILPKQRTFSRNQTFKAPIEKVFEVVTDLKGQESWRSDVKEIQVKSAVHGKEIWIEIPKNQPPIHFRSIAKIQNQLYEMDIEGQGFNGHWVGTFEKGNDGTTKVNFTEIATVPNPFLRVFAYLFIDLGKSIDLYINDLSKKLNAQSHE